MIQAIPSLARLARKRGERLDVGVLARIPACAEVLRGLPFIASTFPVADPWNDFAPANTWAGYQRGMRALDATHGGTLVWTSRPDLPTDPLWCKAARIADELGVEFDPSEAPTIALGGENRDEGLMWAARKASGHAFAIVHGSSGNPSKDVEPQVLAPIVVRHCRARAESRGAAFDGVQLASFPIKTEGVIDSIDFHAGVLDGADAFVGVDSGPAHLASAIVRDVVWVFRSTPVQQAIPLWRDVRAVCVGPDADGLIASWQAWRTANRSLVRHEVLVEKGAA